MRAFLFATTCSVYLLATGLCLAEGPVCRSLSDGASECTSIENFPSGQRIFREWRRKSESLPYAKEIQGATSGTILIKTVRLVFVKKSKLWVIQFSDGKIIDLLSVGEPNPKIVKGINDAGHEWEITINNASYPKIIPGIATEDEPKLDLRLVRLN